MTLSSSVKTYPYYPPTDDGAEEIMTATGERVGQQHQFSASAPPSYDVGETYGAASQQYRPPSPGSGGIGGGGPAAAAATATVVPPRAVNVTAVEYGSSTPPPHQEQTKYVYIDSRKPVTLTMCPSCTKQHVTTSTRTKPNGVTAICVVAGVFIFWPLCWIPLCIRPMKQTNHYCTCCGAKVGRVKPFQ